ncbi:MAG: hypothetical protein ACI9F9_001136 [Candidatus Paceibacteria bacterium]|jgi:hypothetical protein
MEPNSPSLGTTRPPRVSSDRSVSGHESACTIRRYVYLVLNGEKLRLTAA